MRPLPMAFWRKGFDNEGNASRLHLMQKIIQLFFFSFAFCLHIRMKRTLQMNEQTNEQNNEHSGD